MIAVLLAAALQAQAATQCGTVSNVQAGVDGQSLVLTVTPDTGSDVNTVYIEREAYRAYWALGGYLQTAQICVSGTRVSARTVSVREPSGMTFQAAVDAPVRTAAQPHDPFQSVPRDGAVTVCVEHSGRDTVGARLAYSVREALRRSAGLPLGECKDAVLEIALVTLDPEQNNERLRGVSTVAAVSYLVRRNQYLLTSSIQLAGSDRVDVSAQDIVAKMDRELADVRRYVR